MLETFYIDCHCPQNLISVSYHISGQLTCLTMKQPYPLQNFSLDLNFSEEWLARPYRGQSPLALCPLFLTPSALACLGTKSFLDYSSCLHDHMKMLTRYMYIYIYIYMLSIFISLLFSFRTILYVSIVYGLGNVIVAVTAVPSILESVKL